MTPAFLYLLDVVLATRLPVLLRDDPVKPGQVVTTVLVQAVALLAFVPGRAAAVLAIAICALGTFGWFLERTADSLPAKRLLMLILYTVSFGVLCSPFLGIQFRLSLGELATAAEPYFFPARVLHRIDGRSFDAYLLGILLSLNEANLLVRYVIERLGLRPPQAAKEDAAAAPEKPAIEKREYDRGRLIGLLERLIIFFLVVQSQFTTLGFVITAKGIARFKELENREFAEYFLIGTMLSVAVAGAVALLIKNLVP
jgi:hypothetical protein